MGAVFSASHRNGMRFAIKVLHPECAKIEGVKTRFLREGYIANRIEHPSVCRILDDDEDADGTAFIVMELLHGKTVEKEWKANGKRLSIPRVVAIADRLLNVLDVAHGAGVIHRDIKPDNLFWTTDGELKVLDFGIARLVQSRSMTQSGTLMGTAEFISPEQAGGLVRDIDNRSDLFSVGALMFSLLSGQFTQLANTTAQFMVYAATQKARSIFDVMPGIPPMLANVIDVSLAFKKEHRWASAQQMQAALRSATGSIQATVVPPPVEHSEPSPGYVSETLVIQGTPPRTK
jgi:serine/threonine-protein kinase